MWILVTCFGTSILTALLPWMNAEVMLLSATPFVASQSAVMTLVAVVTAGQMTGTGASPTPVGFSALGTMWTSIATGASGM